jgi:hypothetical protein
LDHPLVKANVDSFWIFGLAKDGLSPPGLAKIERVQFHSGPAFSNLQVVPAQNKQKQEGMTKTDVSAASLPGEDIERIS